MRTNILLLTSFFLWTCVSAQAVSSKDSLDVSLADTALQLKEVTVSAARVVHKVDRKLYLPSRKAVESSSNGYDLLQKIKLPQIRVSEANQTISSFLGGVQVRINDVKASTQDIMALRPDEVTRIEFIDQPGVRYGDDGLYAVINYVVRRRYAGYVGGVTTMQALWEGFNNSDAYFKYNYKKSEFSLGYGLNYRCYDERHTDAYSTYYKPNGEERRLNYVGYNTDMMYNNHGIQLGYNLAEPDKYTLNVKFTLSLVNAPYNKRMQRVEETGKADRFLYTRDKGRGTTPVLDIYYSLNMPHRQNLAVNVVGTYLYNDDTHQQKDFLYRNSVEETLASDDYTDYSYHSDGNKYSLISEAIYTKTFSKAIAFSGGANYNVSRTDNTYTGYQNVNTALNTHNLYSFAQIQGALSVVNYQLGIGASYTSIHQSDVGFNKWTFRPKLTLSTNAIKNMSVRLTSSISPVIPSLSQLSEVRQQGNSMQASDGNSLLQPTSRYYNSIDFSWNRPLFDLYWGGSLTYTPDAIMNSIIYDEQEDLYVWKPENQKSNTSYFAYVTGVLHVIKDVLNIQGELHYTHVKSRGNDYRHDYEPLHYGFSADLSLGRWYVEYGFSNPWKGLGGETFSSGENRSDLTVSYKHKNLRIGLGCLLLGYAQGFNYKSRTDSKYYKSETQTHLKNNGNMVYLTLSYNFSHGRKYEAERRKLSNSDRDAGLR